MKTLTFKQINELVGKSHSVIDELRVKNNTIKLPVYIASYGPHNAGTTFSIKALYKITKVRYELESPKNSPLSPIYSAYANGIYVTQNDVNHFKEKRLYIYDFFASGGYNFLVLSNKKEFDEACIKVINTKEKKLNNILKEL